MTFVRRDQTGIDDDRTIRRTAELFGVARLGAHVRERLERVLRSLPVAEPSATPRDTGEPPEVSPQVVSAVDDAGTTSRPLAAASAEPVQESPASPIPVIATLVAEANALRPDLEKVDEFAYYDYRLGRSLPADLREPVNEIVLDPAFNGGSSDDVVEEKTSHLASDVAESVGWSATRVWRAEVRQGSRSDHPQNRKTTR